MVWRGDGRISVACAAPIDVEELKRQTLQPLHQVWLIFPP
jgi:hypothetical protein